MDEPEVSLHVEWQQRLISLIRELNPNVQIVLTTHSPALVMDGWLDADYRSERYNTMNLTKRHGYGKEIIRQPFFFIYRCGK